MKSTKNSKEDKNKNAHGLDRVDETAILAMATPKTSTTDVQPIERDKIRLILEGDAEQAYRQQRFGKRRLAHLALTVSDMIKDGRIASTDESTDLFEGETWKRFTLKDAQLFEQVCRESDVQREKFTTPKYQAQHMLTDLGLDFDRIKQHHPTLDLSKAEALLAAARRSYTQLENAGGLQNWEPVCEIASKVFFLAYDLVNEEDRDRNIRYAQTLKDPREVEDAKRQTNEIYAALAKSPYPDKVRSCSQVMLRQLKSLTARGGFDPLARQAADQARRNNAYPTTMRGTKSETAPRKRRTFTRPVEDGGQTQQ